MTTRLALAVLLLAGACGATRSEGALLYETPGDRDARERSAIDQADLARADKAMGAGDLDGAADIYRDVAHRDPRSLPALLGLAVVAERKHLDGEAERWLRSAITVSPELIGARYRLVASLLRQRRIADARKEYQDAQAPEHGGPGDERTQLRLKGAIALREGQATQAAALFDELIELAPDDASGWLGLAVSLAVAGDDDEALAKLDKAFALAPRSPVAYYDLALVRYHKKQLDLAVAAGREAVKLDPWFLPARNNLAAALLSLSKTDDAKQILADAIALRPTYAPAHNNLGIVLLAAGDDAGAARELELAVHHAPRVAAFHENLGLAYFRLKRYDDARAEFQAVVTLDASNGDAARNLRWLDGLKAGTISGTELPASSSKFAVDEFNE